MTGEQVPTWLLEAGDVIRVCHHHDSQCGECPARWETDAVVTEKPARGGDRAAAQWAGGARLPGATPAITRARVFTPGAQARRIRPRPACRAARVGGLCSCPLEGGAGGRGGGVVFSGRRCQGWEPLPRPVARAGRVGEAGHASERAGGESIAVTLVLLGRPPASP